MRQLKKLVLNFTFADIAHDTYIGVKHLGTIELEKAD
jgi:hypothetical protein